MTPPKSRARRLTRRTVSTAAAAVAVLGALSVPPAHADAVPQAPVFRDGFGLTQVADGSVVRSGTDFTLTVTSAEVAGPHRIRVFLPSGYADDPDRRWPVTYFLHGGPGTVDDAAGVPALRSEEMITVVPDGGRKGWYADWVMRNTALGAANWETFHLDQVVPFIDANLRTAPDRDHRAVSGLSMGGSGALHYAEARPDLFGHVAALSGGLDFSMAEVRAAVLATELNLPGAWCALGSGTPGSCADYGPYVDSDAIFGSPYPVFDADRVWKAYDPAAPTNLSRLAGTAVTLYTGDNDLIEGYTARAARTVASRLKQLGVPSRLVDYGNGASLDPACTGNHSYTCWAPAFADWVPRLTAAFASAS
ncbi:alpha/beta hydrolase family protein [uncultured Streptomyces sp.]|uniref:alpha/beta hydrolase n=1 Tax=uncultured Streptomyces sp. TaxID=174707 RepID=UPI002629B0F8|nr:alpha/beta hydrolase-fold protein [uncultured Streptomyces sp.]